MIEKLERMIKHLKETSEDGAFCSACVHYSLCSEKRLGCNIEGTAIDFCSDWKKEY